MGRRRLPFIAMTAMLFALSTGSAAWGDDWVCYARGSNRECRQYYNKNVERVKNSARVETRLPVTNEISSSVKSLRGDDAYMIVSKMFDCRKGTVSVLKTTVHKKDGAVSSSVDGDASVRHQIDPDSRDGSLFRIVCKKGRTDK